MFSLWQINVKLSFAVAIKEFVNLVKINITLNATETLRANSMN
jgi:hypothetical protein